MTNEIDDSKPDEPHPTMGPGWFIRFPKDWKTKHVDLRTYYLIEDQPWFTKAPTTICDLLGFKIEPGKLNNLLSFANSELSFWYFLTYVIGEHADDAETTNEIINFILGSLAGALKNPPGGTGIALEFKDINKVIHVGAIREYANAIALGMVPKSIRKALDILLITEFNATHSVTVSHTVSAEEATRIVLYEMIAELTEEILAQPSGESIVPMFLKVLEDNPKQADLLRAEPDNQKLIGWAMGQIMRASVVKLDPNFVRGVIIEQLK
jgi:hypothetical protein